MKLVIDIPKRMYEKICDNTLGIEIFEAIKNGTPLPGETAERYKPIILQEHDAEPRTMRAILDVETNDIYILETTKGFAEGMGMTIEEVADEISN